MFDQLSRSFPLISSKYLSELPEPPLFKRCVFALNRNECFIWVISGPAPLKAKLPDLILDEPAAQLVAPVRVSAERFGRVDKIYVSTQADQVISPAFQAQMIPRTPVRKVVSLQTGHLPFLTDIDGMSQAIENATA